MAKLVEVIARGYYARTGGNTHEIPVGTQIVVRGVPAALSNKLKVLKDVADTEMKINDTPDGAGLRADGKAKEADESKAKAAAAANKKHATTK